MPNLPRPRCHHPPRTTEAFEHGGRAVGLTTVVGFLVAGILSIAG